MFSLGLMGRRLAVRFEEPETGVIIATLGWRGQTVCSIAQRRLQHRITPVLKSRPGVPDKYIRH